MERTPSLQSGRAAVTRCVRERSQKERVCVTSHSALPWPSDVLFRRRLCAGAKRRERGREERGEGGKY